MEQPRASSTSIVDSMPGWTESGITSSLLDVKVNTANPACLPRCDISTVFFHDPGFNQGLFSVTVSCR